MSTVNVIPMAGTGSRFKDAGYLLPKPLIPVSGEPMIVSAIRHMPKADKWVFMVRQEHVDAYRIDEVIRGEIPGAVIVPVDKTTEGQASTCMLAMPHIAPNDSIFIAACDNAFLYDKKAYARLVADPSVDSVVWTFTDDPLLEASPKSWGWVKLAEDGKTVADMSVKVPVSDAPRKDHAVVASFFFRRAKDFSDAYGLMTAENHRINNEFYVDSMPIFLKRLGKRSVIFDVALYVGWGKPSDLYVYEQKEHECAWDSGSDPDRALWKRFFAENGWTSHTGGLSRQLPRFLVAGLSAVATDLAAYALLVGALDHSPAKAISFLSGTVVAYVVNKYWTFEKRERSYREAGLFLCLYLLTLAANVAVNKLSLDLTGSVGLSFLAATATSTVLNFAGQKWVVFK